LEIGFQLSVPSFPTPNPSGLAKDFLKHPNWGILEIAPLIVAMTECFANKP